MRCPHIHHFLSWVAVCDIQSNSFVHAVIMHLRLWHFPALSVGVIDLEVQSIPCLFIELKDHRRDVGGIWQTYSWGHTRMYNVSTERLTR